MIDITFYCYISVISCSWLLQQSFARPHRQFSRLFFSQLDLKTDRQPSPFVNWIAFHRLLSYFLPINFQFLTIFNFWNIFIMNFLSCLQCHQWPLFYHKCLFWKTSNFIWRLQNNNCITEILLNFKRFQTQYQKSFHPVWLNLFMWSY